MYDIAPGGHDACLALTHLQRARMAVVVAQIDRLNSAIDDAVADGLSIELRRSEGHHCSGGCWGDRVKAVVVDCK